MINLLDKRSKAQISLHKISNLNFHLNNLNPTKNILKNNQWNVHVHFHLLHDFYSLKVKDQSSQMKF